MPKYKMSVIGGTSDGQYTHSGKYAAGARVTVTADPAPEGQMFKEWTGIPDKWIIEGSKTSPTVTFSMPAYTQTVTAKYEDAPSVGVDPPGQPTEQPPEQPTEQPTGKFLGALHKLANWLEANGGVFAHVVFHVIVYYVLPLVRHKAA